MAEFLSELCRGQVLRDRLQDDLADDSVPLPERMSSCAPCRRTGRDSISITRWEPMVCDSESQALDLLATGGSVEDKA